MWHDNTKKVDKLEVGHKKEIDDLKERQKDIESSLSAHRENAAEKYVTRAEVKGDLGEIKQLIHNLGNKLDGKADK